MTVQLSIQEIAKLTGLHRNVVAQRVKSLPFEDGPGRSKLYDSVDALRITLCPSWGTDGDNLDPQAERAALDRARRLEVEQRTAEKARELLPAEEVIQTWVRLVTVARGRLLGMPPRLAAELAAMEDAREVERKLRTEVIAILRELSEADGMPGGATEAAESGNTL